MRKTIRQTAIGCLMVMGSLWAQAPKEAPLVPEDHRPPLFFREDFSNERVKRPLTSAILANQKLAIGLYGEGQKTIDKVRHDSPKDDPSYLWLGDCLQPCAFTLKHKESLADLSGLAKVRWRTKQSGFHQLRLALKLAGGLWLVSDYSEGPSTDWRESEVSIADIRWRRFNPQRVLEGDWEPSPDLTKVDEIGFTDLAPGTAGPRPAMGSRVDWIEIYGQTVPR